MGMFGSSSIEGWLQLQLSNQVDISLLNVWNKTKEKPYFLYLHPPSPHPKKWGMMWTFKKEALFVVMIMITNNKITIIYYSNFKIRLLRDFKKSIKEYR